MKRINKQTENDKKWMDLMLAAQKGDSHAYEHLLSEISIVLRGFVHKRVGALNMTEDIVQDILLAVHHARHTYDPQKSFSVWLFSISRYKTIDALRKYYSTSKAELLYAEEKDIFHNQSIKSLSLEMTTALSKLPQKQRRIIEMLKVEDCPVKEVAQKLNISESSVKVTAHRGYKILKKMVVRMNYGNN